ncbi:exodeoxyribonuclease V subunit gamma [Aggregatibacter actinomycetemcomitans]|uniref:exodeoxyribonuclease V subunit gamma n=1 Tax=Aggregatibacter actinomycetemcomitans TaxID=714 RepID=UPI001E4036C0|nr:exodeoxyribonuclease V subunit gamma [Aggregatibacter actinomycetemcomitans]
MLGQISGGGVFTVYHSNQLEVQKDILVELIQRQPLNNPLQPEIALVQSPGMAQWLQLQIAGQKGIAANFAFPMPASFIWQLYAENLLDVAQSNQFNKNAMMWRLVRLIPQYLQQDALRPLRHYLAYSAQSEQFKLYQLAGKIADLFDQYLVYRPDWIAAWENQQDDDIRRQIESQLSLNNERLLAQITQNIAWQGILWRALVRAVKADTGLDLVQHRAHLHQLLLEKLRENRPLFLPERLFIFGIPALPKAYLEIFQAISQYCDVHLFFNNPCEEYWGDIVDPKFVEKLALRTRTDYFNHADKPLLSAEQAAQAQQHWELTYAQEKLQVGNSLLASWGKLGRDFSYLLAQLEPNDISAYVEITPHNLLSQIQHRILHLTPNGSTPLNYRENDRTLTFHSCHSMMREVEVLQDYLLHLLQQEPDLTPKDIIVMVADIDKYTPYIRAVFGQNATPQTAIPFSISDNKLSENNVIIAGFLTLLQLKESTFSAEDVLALLDVPAIRQRFNIELQDLAQIRDWVKNAGVRFGLAKNDEAESNYNSWQAGLERMLLGYALREENGIWQDSLGLDNSFGLKGQLAGQLAAFLAALFDWFQTLQSRYSIEQWQQHLLALTDKFFSATAETDETLFYIKEVIQQFAEQLAEVHFNDALGVDVVADVMNNALEENPNHYRFLAGKVNFCTLLPMRSIPFRVVCLLGMNDGEYPRQQAPNSFDLMQYHRLKGDRARRDDDRYLFLEALLSAQDYLYISYIGRSIADNQEREPSVLVSQLLDYIVENLPAENTPAGNLKWRERLIQQHGMTAFSRKNFEKNDRTFMQSFAQQWLPLANSQANQTLQDFIQPMMADAEPEEEIEFSRLVAFVKNPVKFFFEKRLGVNFSEQEESIADSENFALDNALEKYAIHADLLEADEQQTDAFFARLKVKGVLPRGEFSAIYANQLLADVAEFKGNIADYVSQTPQSRFLQFTVLTQEGDMTLSGNISYLYGDNLQRVTWRMATVKDKDRIEAWLYHLLLCATQEQPTESLFQGKDQRVRFNVLPQQDAVAQLQIYVESYLAGRTQLQLIPTTNLEAYLKLIADESAVDVDKCFSLLNKIAMGDERSPGDLYWRRVLVQTQELDLNWINRQVNAWFAPMLQAIKREK